MRILLNLLFLYMIVVFPLSYLVSKIIIKQLGVSKDRPGRQQILVVLAVNALLFITMLAWFINSLNKFSF